MPTSVTLNDLERILAVILGFCSPNSIDLQANYVTRFEDRPIMVATYRLPLPFFDFWPKLLTLQRGITAIAVLLVKFSHKIRLSLRCYTLDGVTRGSPYP